MSGHSRVSKSLRASSLIDLSKADEIAELAAKEAELNTLQKEAKRKKEIAKMEAQLRAKTTRIACFPYSDNPSTTTSAAGAQAFKIGRNRIKGKTAHSAASRRAQVS